MAQMILNLFHGLTAIPHHPDRFFQIESYDPDAPDRTYFDTRTGEWNATIQDDRQIEFRC